MKVKILIVLAVGCLFLALLFWLTLKIRRRWQQGKRDFEEMRGQARAMNLESQPHLGGEESTSR
jgi:hypothetical protein